MRVATTVEEVRSTVFAAQKAGETIGFVPTMGALHEGHLSLVDASLKSCDRTVVSIFVNPTQFGAGEDEDSYPRRLAEDCRLLEERDCWLVFAPPVAEMYPPGFDTSVDVGEVATPLEGEARPTHFQGVATVVLKLFQIVPADCAFFGRKDYQQSLVIQQMVRDLNLPVQIVTCPIVREADGLAMSSRNAYLNPTERQRATALWQSLQLAEERFRQGQTEVSELTAAMRQHLAAAGVEEVNYIAFLEAGTVRPVAQVKGPTVVAIAARVGGTRLIDNHQIG